MPRLWWRSLINQRSPCWYWLITSQWLFGRSQSYILYDRLAAAAAVYVLQPLMIVTEHGSFIDVHPRRDSALAWSLRVICCPLPRRRRVAEEAVATVRQRDPSRGPGQSEGYRRRL